MNLELRPNYPDWCGCAALLSWRSVRRLAFLTSLTIAVPAAVCTLPTTAWAQAKKSVRD